MASMSNTVYYDPDTATRLFGAKAVLKTWRTEMDEKVCKACARLNGKSANWNRQYGRNAHHIGHGIQHPPLHPNCRCHESIKWDRPDATKAFSKIFEKMADAIGKVFDIDFDRITR